MIEIGLFRVLGSQWGEGAMIEIGLFRVLVSMGQWSDDRYNGIDGPGVTGERRR